MKQKINPVVAVVIAVVVLIGLGLTGMKVMSSAGSEEAKPMSVKVTNPNDPKYQRDPKLAGGGQ